MFYSGVVLLFQLQENCLYCLSPEIHGPRDPNRTPGNNESGVGWIEWPVNPWQNQF